MRYTFNHFNFNVKNLDESIAFYKEALGFEEQRRITPENGAFIIAFLTDQKSDFSLELTWLKEHPQPYDLGECEFHLAVTTDDYNASLQRHRAMGCVCFENPDMGIYFISDPDGYWIEVIPQK